MENIKTTINIRALISVYENKAANKESTYPRSRSGSVGNVLSKNVIVKENQIKTLGDVHNILESIEQRLNQYEIYNKEKHVSFQEELFNILTSIINIDNDDPEEAKALITKTKNYVSFLNNKLPSNGLTSRYSNQVSTFSEPEKIVKEKPTFKAKYKNFKSVDAVAGTVNVENNDEIDSMKPTIPVKVLKEIFQVPEVQKNDNKESKLVKTKQTTYKSHVAVSLYNKNVKNNTSNDQRVVTNGENTTHSKIEEAVEKPYEIASYTSVPVSVVQLRNIFETKSRENATGLPLILNEEKPPITRFNYKTNIAETTKPEDLERIQVSSYLRSIEDDSNGLLEILKRERQPREFNYVLNINNDEEDTNHIETRSYLENSDFDQMSSLEYTESSGGNDDNNDDDGEGGSVTSSEESVKSVDSVKRAVIRVENVNSEASNDSGMIVGPTEDTTEVISVEKVNLETTNDFNS